MTMFNHCIIWFVTLMGCNGGKSLLIDIYPGFGWDHLRFMDMAPIFAVSNFNTSDALQACVEIIPLHQNNIETGSVEIDTFDSQSNGYEKNSMIGGSVGFQGIKIGGSYSKEYQTMKQEQGREKTIALRNEIDYLLADVILLPSCPLHPQVKHELLEIAKHHAMNENELATYFAQLFVKRYGTHLVSRLHLGGSIVEEDFISFAEYNNGVSQKQGYKAAAEGSFLGSFGLSASYSSGSSNSEATVNEFKKKIQRKVLSSQGGDVFILGANMQAWQASLKTKPAIIRRAIDNITQFINADKIPEMNESALYRVRKEIDDAIDTYVEMNTYPGCMDRNSPSFNAKANVADGSCVAASQTIQFGGFIVTCSEDPSRTQVCKQLEQKHYYTGTDLCESGFNRYKLHTFQRFEDVYYRQCKECGVFVSKICCEDFYGGREPITLTLHACNRNVTQNQGYLGADDFRLQHVFGGSYTAGKVNPITNSYSCPQDFSVVNEIEGIKVCLARNLGSKKQTFPLYGGIYSCHMGNVATKDLRRACPEGFSVYSMGVIPGNCMLEACLKFETANEMTELPAIALPPFISIEAIYNTRFVNETQSGGTTNNSGA